MSECEIQVDFLIPGGTLFALVVQILNYCFQKHEAISQKPENNNEVQHLKHYQL